MSRDGGRAGRALEGAAAALLAAVIAAGCTHAAMPDAGAGRAPASSGRTASIGPVPASATAEPEGTRASPAVAAVYAAGASVHGCTGTVVSTPDGTAVLTAAHCVAGDGRGMTVVPALDGSERPYGTWAVASVHVTQAWLDRQDPTDDFAILLVEHGPIGARSPRTIQSAVGGFPVGRTAKPGAQVTVTAYNTGSDTSVSCTTSAQWAETGRGRAPSLPCDGFTGGSSGSAWVTTGTGAPEIVGLIGGPFQGGCRSDVSYSARMAHLRGLIDDVVAGRSAAATVPKAAASGC